MFNKIMTGLAYFITALSALMIVLTWGQAGSTIAWVVAFVAWLQIATIKKYE